MRATVRQASRDHQHTSPMLTRIDAPQDRRVLRPAHMADRDSVSSEHRPRNMNSSDALRRISR
jgi:hypothetical protein